MTNLHIAYYSHKIHAVHMHTIVEKGSLETMPGSYRKLRACSGRQHHSQFNGEFTVPSRVELKGIDDGRGFMERKSSFVGPCSDKREIKDVAESVIQILYKIEDVYPQGGIVNLLKQHC